MKKITAFLSAAAMVVSLAACGGGASESTSPKGSSAGNGEVQEVSLHLPTVYDLPDADMVEAEINKIAEGKYGLRFDINYIPLGSWQQQSNILFTGDEADVIAVFFTPLTTFVKNGQLTDLTDYYANASEEFKGVWSEEEMKGTTIDGKIYAVPNLRNFGNYLGLNIDVEVAAELGVEDGQKLTMEDVSNFLYAAHEKYPERYALTPQNVTTLIGQWTWDGLGDERWVGVLEDCGQNTTVQNILDIDDFTEFCTWAEKWYNDGLIMPDILSNTTPFQTMILNKQAISAFDNYGVSAISGCIRTVVVDKWAQSNSYQALCYGINQNSSRKDAAWKAIEVLYTDKEICTLLTDGIEGKHYVVNEDGTISFPDGKSAADCGYGMAEGYWIVPYSGDTYPLDVNGPSFFEDLITFNKELLKTKAFGFAFDAEPVTDQYAACISVMDKYYNPLMSGAVDVESTIAQAKSELEAAGINEVIAEKQRQLDEFLSTQ